MPAISVYGRIEAHVTDSELLALNKLMCFLLQGNTDVGQSLFLAAAAHDSALSHEMMTGVCSVYGATQRAIRERAIQG